MFTWYVYLIIGFEKFENSFSDIKVKEPTLESLTKKKREYLPPLFMSVKEASKQLLEILETHSNNESG